MTKPLSLIHKDEEINVLIVEDEVVLAMAMEMSLEKLGFNVSGIETNSNKAVLHTQNNPVDIVLMDINLSKSSSGIEAANKIWKMYKIPIIFITSYTNDKTIKDAMECEPYGYLIKPCREGELKAAINMALHKHRFFFKNQKELNSNKDFLYLIRELKYDKTNSKLFKKDQEIKLTKNEKKFFDIISQNPKEYVSFEVIYAYIWREDVYDLGKLRTLIYRLKQKIGFSPIENIYEQGYKLRMDKNLG